MKYPLISLSEVSDHFLYQEYPNKYDGAFLEISKKNNQICITVDRFRQVEFFYCVFQTHLYGATTLNQLLKELPAAFKRKLNSTAAIELFATNTILGDKTLLENIFKITYGSTLTFDTSSHTLIIKSHWQLPENSDPALMNSRDVINQLYTTFSSAVDTALGPLKDCRIGVHVTGGFDSRQLLGAFLEKNVSFKGLNYGISGNIDSKITKTLCNKLGIPLHIFPWNSLVFFKDNISNCMNLYNYSQSLFQCHGFEILGYEYDHFDCIFLNHFIDLFLQAHNYNPLFDTRNQSNQNLDNALIDHFSRSFSGDKESYYLHKCSHGLLQDSLRHELSLLNHYSAEKKYEAFYLLHHGLNRLFPQIRAGSKKLPYKTIGTIPEYFDFAWKIPGHLKKHRLLQARLIQTHYKKALKTPMVKDNKYLVSTNALSPLNHFNNLRYKLLNRMGLNSLFGIKTVWGYDFNQLVQASLSDWILTEVKESNLFENQLFSSDFVDTFTKSPSLLDRSKLGALLTLSQFQKHYL